MQVERAGLGDGGIPGASTIQNRMSIQESKLISFFGRMNYNINDRYLLAASVRRDGSSRFGVDNAWGTFPSVSLIKVAVLVTLLDEVERGRVALSERSTMIARDRVGGSGILQHMQSGVSLSLEDLAWLMITISDNTATNLTCAADSAPPRNTVSVTIGFRCCADVLLLD